MSPNRVASLPAPEESRSVEPDPSSAIQCPTKGEAMVTWIVATLESSSPSLAWNVKLSDPVAPKFGV